MKIYLGSPIDTGGGDIRIDLWRETAKRLLREDGWTVFCPASVKWLGEVQDNEIFRVNHMQLMQSDGMMGLLPPGVRTVGVPWEIALMWRSGIPTVVIAEDKSVQLSGAGIEIYSFRHIEQAILDLEMKVTQKRLLNKDRDES